MGFLDAVSNDVSSAADWFKQNVEQPVSNVAQTIGNDVSSFGTNLAQNYGLNKYLFDPQVTAATLNAIPTFAKTAFNDTFMPSVEGPGSTSGIQSALNDPNFNARKYTADKINTFNTGGIDNLATKGAAGLGDLVRLNPEVAAIRFGSNLGQANSFGDVASAAGDYALNRFAGSKVPGFTEAMSPLARLGVTSAYRGAQATAFGSGDAAVQNGQPIDPTTAAEQFALGAAGNIIASPRLALSAADQATGGALSRAGGRALNNGTITYNGQPIPAQTVQAEVLGKDGQPFNDMQGTNQRPQLSDPQAQADAFVAKEHPDIAQKIGLPSESAQPPISFSVANDGLGYTSSPQIASDIASKYSSPQEFINAVRAPLDYGMSHRPNEMGPGHNIASSDGIPADVYTNPQWYFNMRDPATQDSFKAIQSAKDKPDSAVTIYRAGPQNQLNNGDWVSLSKKYATDESHQESTPVHSFQVKAKDIQFAGDSINEFGYFPTDSTLTEMYANAKSSPSVQDQGLIKPLQASIPDEHGKQGLPNQAVSNTGSGSSGVGPGPFGRIGGDNRPATNQYRDIRGETVSKPEDVSALLKDYRNPKREVLHAVYAKDGKVVAHNATTSNMPDAATLPGGSKFLDSLKDRAARLGADSVYLAHNHPSGEVDPSHADRLVTNAVQKKLGPLFKGHVILDHDQTTVLQAHEKDGTGGVGERQVSVDLGKSYKGTGVSLTNGEQVGKFIGHHSDPKPGKIGIVVVDKRMRPVGYREVTANSRTLRTTINQTIRSESGFTSFLSLPARGSAGAVKKAVEEGGPLPVVDAFMHNGKDSSRSILEYLPDNSFGAKTFQKEEDRARTGKAITLHDSGVDYSKVGSEDMQAAADHMGFSQQRKMVSDIVGESAIKAIKDFAKTKAYSSGKVDATKMPELDQMAQEYNSTYGTELSDEEFFDHVQSLKTKTQLEAMRPKSVTVARPVVSKPVSKQTQAQADQTNPLFSDEEKKVLTSQPETPPRVTPVNPASKAAGPYLGDGVTGHPAPYPETYKTPYKEPEVTPKQRTKMQVALSKLDPIIKSTRDEVAMHGPSAKRAGDMVYAAREKGERFLAEAASKLPTVMKLKPAEFSKAWDVAEAKATSSNPKIVQAAKELRAADDALYALAKKNNLSGLKGKIENHMPHIQPKGAYEGKQLEEKIKYVIEKGLARTRAEAVELVLNQNVPNTRSGSLTHSREADLPGYMKDRPTFMGYLKTGYKSIAEQQAFGKDKAKLMTAVSRVAAEGGNVTRVNSLVQQMIDPHVFDGPMKNFTNGIRSINAVTSLGTAVLSHIPQLANLTTLTGYGRTFLAVGKVMTPEGREYVQRSGVVLDKVIKEINAQYAPQYDGKMSKIINGISNAVTAPGLHQVLGFYKSLAAISGRDMANSIANDLVSNPSNPTAAKRLSALGIDPRDVLKQKGVLTDEQHISASRKIAEWMIGRYDNQDLPAWSNTAIGKLITQFKAPLYKQSQFVLQHVIGPAIGQGPMASGKPNLLPLFKFLVLGVPLYVLAQEVKDKIHNTIPKAQSVGRTIAKDLSSLGGLTSPVFDYITGNIDYPNYKTDHLLSLLGGPTLSNAASTASNIADTINGKPKNLEKELVSKVPIVGPYASKDMFPSKAQIAAKDGTGGTTASATPGLSGIAQLLKDLGLALPGSSQAAAPGANAVTDYAAFKKASDSTATSQKTKDANAKTVASVTGDQATNFAARLAYEKAKGALDAHVALVAEQTKSAGDLKGWLTNADHHITDLKTYQKTLDPKKDAQAYDTVQRQIDMLKTESQKYINENGFTKGTKANNYNGTGNGPGSKASAGSSTAKAQAADIRMGQAKAIKGETSFSLPKASAAPKLATPKMAAPKYSLTKMTGRGNAFALPKKGTVRNSFAR